MAGSITRIAQKNIYLCFILYFAVYIVLVRSVLCVLDLVVGVEEEEVEPHCCFRVLFRRCVAKALEMPRPIC